MKANLDSLKTEIAEYLENGSFVVFHGASRAAEEEAPVVEWDHVRHPDFRDFLQVAEQVGEKLVVFHSREFSVELIDEALERIEAADLPREESRGLERRLRELRGYEGFTCAIELSFDHATRMYLYSVQTDWYEDLLDILDDLESSLPDEEDEGEEGPIGGYFSRN
jgi:hypothetical protein